MHASLSRQVGLEEKLLRVVAFGVLVAFGDEQIREHGVQHFQD